MRKPLLAAVLASLSVVAAGQGGHAEDKDAVGIRSALDFYVSPEPAKVREAFYQSANLYSASEKGELRTITLEQFLGNIFKGAAAGQARPTMSIDFIDHVGNAATARVTEISDVARVTDYFSLVRDASGWKVVSKTFDVEHKTEAKASTQVVGQPANQSLCPSDELRALSFLAGDWHTSEMPTNSVGPITGASRTEKILNGCAIWEHRYMQQAGKQLFDAHVVWGYDVTTNHMLLFYVDDGSHTQLYEGRREDGHWAFYRERPGDKDQTILIRVTYTRISRGFTQTVEKSRDHGQTWEIASVISYEPKS